jgi:hypothetical protein
MFEFSFNLQPCQADLVTNEPAKNLAQQGGSLRNLASSRTMPTDPAPESV